MSRILWVPKYKFKLMDKKIFRMLRLVVRKYGTKAHIVEQKSVNIFLPFSFNI